ncbi:MAG: type II toxin-antitoxin system VapC family toxin [Treponema sp.]|nr:type II toxin-antitoxin system VapC family toxin [Treponema sp.]
MVYVIDASFFAASILPDEQKEYALQFFSSIGEDDTLYVPHLWWYELGNILKKALVRKRLEYSEALVMVSHLTTLKISTDSEYGSVYTGTLLRLARDYDLTVYDAVYLELALRMGAVLGTLDGNLKAAARKHGVEVV